MYPYQGQITSANHTLPNFATMEALATARGMYANAPAMVPGQVNGIYRYDAATPAARRLWQDDLYNLVDWVPGGEGTLTVNPVSPGEAVPTFVWPTVNGEWRGPSITRDLGASIGDFFAAVDVNWLNNSVGALGRVLLDVLDASQNPLFSIEIGDGSGGTSTTYVQALQGAEIVLNGNAVGSPVSVVLSTANPNSYAGWLSIRRVGSSVGWWYQGGLVRSASGMSTTAARFVRLRCQVFRSGGTNFPAVNTMNLRGLCVLANPANGASNALAISTGGAGSAATLPNAFDGNTTTVFDSGLNDAANYSGAAYVGQQQASAPYYQRLAYVQLTQSNVAANNASAFDLLMADDVAGPWDTVASFANLPTTASGLLVLPVPVGLPGRRCWRVQPTAGITAGNTWRLAELRGDYAPAEGNPANGVQARYQNGQWLPFIPADSGANLAKKLAWMRRR